MAAVTLGPGDHSFWESTVETATATADNVNAVIRRQLLVIAEKYECFADSRVVARRGRVWYP